MGKSPDERITTEIGRDICQRNGAKALLVGSIASLGSQYVITLDAINAATGDTLAEVQGRADSKEQVLKTLDQTTTELREKLGESLASIQKFDKPLEEATTSSLEALKTYTLGDAKHSAGDDLASIPLYKRDRKSTRLNSSHGYISYAVFCLKKKSIYHTYDGSALPCVTLSSVYYRTRSTASHTLPH